MAAISNADPRRMYSWWWDSHISPKNSKWLHENLTDMDSKVKQMTKLIEEDADSFARRAEMYYKKRPELMKMVEDFYRAYRALAARYDHATGVLRQAHRTMSEAFPNQVPLLGDDSPAVSDSTRAFLDPDELQKDFMGFSSSHFHTTKRIVAFTEDADSLTSRKGLKELNDLLKFSEGRARKNNVGNDHKAITLSESDRVSRTETEIIALKNTLAKLEAEKEAGLLQYQQSLDRLSKLESEVSRAQEDSNGFNERAGKAESEVHTLKELIAKLEAEREVSLLQYEQCLEKVSNLESIVLHAQNDAGELDERATKAQIKVESLKQNIAIMEAEKEAALVQYKQCLEKLRHAEEDARRMNERAENAECNVETLKQALAKLAEEKEAAGLQYQQCLELIASLEHKLVCAQEENLRLHCDLDNGVAKLKGSEEKCLLLEKSNQSLNSELESVMQMMRTQSHELTEKQKELGRLWACMQEEHFQFMETETALKTLQQLHSQSQEEIRNLAAELQPRAQLLKDMETLSQGLQVEIQKVKEENNDLNQLNGSSALSVTMLEGEIVMLKEMVQKLEGDVEVQVDQRNALQQEIYCLKEELNDLNQNHQAVLQQVESVGLDHECFGSSVKKLQDKNSELNEIHARDINEKAILREKLQQMEKLIEEKAILENSILELNVELEGVREKVIAFEESYEHLLSEKIVLVAEKTTLISQLHITIQNLERVSEEKQMLESSLLDANAELEGLRGKSKSLEDSRLVLNDEKTCLMVERDHLVSQLQDLEKSHAELNEKHLDLEKERLTILSRLEELNISLDTEKQELASFTQLSETRIHILQEEGWRWKKEFGEQLDNAVGAEIEIFILQQCVQDLAENNFSLVNECKTLLEASKSSEKQISKLEHENQEQKLEVMSLVSQIQTLKNGLYQVSKTLDIGVGHDPEDKIGQDITFLNNVICKVEETCVENQQLILEKSFLLTLLDQLGLEAETVASERNFLNQEFCVKSEQFMFLQCETQKLSNMNEELRLQVGDVQLKREVLIIELDSLLEAYQDSQAENFKALDEKRSLVKEISMLVEHERVLEDDIFAVIDENISQNILCLIMKSIVSEKSVELQELSKTLEVLNQSLEKSEVNLRLATFLSDRLAKELASVNDLLHQKEIELLDAVNEKSELFTIVDDMKKEYHEAKMVQEEQENKILALSEDNSLLTKENEFITEANQALEAKLYADHLQREEAKLREKSLSDELEKKNNEAVLWEMEAAALLSEQQTCTVREVLFEQKIHELAEAKDMEIEVLKEKVCTLEGKNGVLNDQLAAYIPVVTSLASCVTSLENHTTTHKDLQQADNTDTKDVNLTSQPENGDPISVINDVTPNLTNLESRIKGIDKAVVEMKRLTLLEHSDTITKLDSAMRQIEDLKSTRYSKLYADHLQREESKLREKSLSDELEKKNNEAVLWEMEAAALLSEQQTCTVREVLFEQKIHELAEAKDMEIEVLKEKVCTLEGKNGVLNDQLAAYIPVVTSLASCVTSLENHTTTHKDLQKTDYTDTEDVNLTSQPENGDPISVINDVTPNLTNLESRIKGIDKAVVEMKRLTLLEHSDTITKLDSAMRQIEDLKSTRYSKLYADHLQREESKLREKSLSDELEKKNNEAVLWEMEAAALLSEQQTCTVREVLFEQKIHELAEAKDMEIEMLKEKVCTLQGKNEVLNDQFAAYIPAVTALASCVTSLENHTSIHGDLQKTDYTDTEDVNMTTQPDNEAPISIIHDVTPNLTNLESRIKGIDKAVVEMKTFTKLQHSDTITKPDSAMTQIQDLKSRSYPKQENADPRKNASLKPEIKPEDLQNQSPKIPEAGNETPPKDIMLDHISECSSYGISKRRTPNPSIQSLSDKELIVDKLEVSKRFTDARQGVNKKKILERLETDAQKLTNLQITLQDVKTKLEITKKSKKGKCIEYETVKEQVQETDEAIVNLCELNSMLTMYVEDGSLSSERMRIIEQARRGSERIMMLQLEVQKMELLLKLENKKKKKVKTRSIEANQNVLLRDYLYGGGKNDQKKRKGHFCACLRHSTKGD